MKVNAEKCVAISQVWSAQMRSNADMNPLHIRGTAGYNEIPMDVVSICLGMPIGFNRWENSKHVQEVLASMLDHARQIGRSKLRITQKCMH
jgi:hypothetical protein